MKSFIESIFYTSVCVSFALAADLANGQVDPSKALLLRSSGKAPQVKDLDSSRYQVKPGVRRSQERPLQSSGPTIKEPTPKDKPPVKQAVELPEATPAEANNERPEVPTAHDNNHRQAMSVGDYRKNIVDLHISPIFFYNESSSNYWYRQYTQANTGFRIAADIWFTPDLGVKTQYTTTTGGSIDGSVSNDGRVSVENDWFSGEIMTRKSFSKSITASSLILAVGYQEYEMKVASLATERIGVKSNGVKLRAEAVIPKSETYHWSLGAEYMPRVTHNELKSQITVKSGSSNESSIIGVHIGGRFLISRKHQMFWRLEHQIEKNLFSGTSNLNDPRSDTSPVTGVDVTNSFTVFSFGYTWGH